MVKKRTTDRWFKLEYFKNVFLRGKETHFLAFLNKVTQMYLYKYVVSSI